MRLSIPVVLACVLCAALCPLLVRGQTMVGSYVPANTSELTDEAEFAVDQLNTKADVPNHPLKLLKIVNAYKQVVQGMNYILELEVSDSTNATHIYNVSVYSPLPVSGQAGNTNPMQLVGYKLADEATVDDTTPIPGGLTPATDDAANAVDAQFVLDQLNSLSAIPSGPLKLAAVVSVQTQVVAGTNVFLQLQALDGQNNTYAVNATVYVPLSVSGFPKSITSYSITMTTMSDLSQFRFPANITEFYDEAKFSVEELNTKSDVDDKPLKLDGIVTAEARVSSTIDIFLGLLVKDSRNKTKLFNVTVNEPLPSSTTNGTMLLSNYTLLANDAVTICGKVLALVTIPVLLGTWLWM